MSTGNDQFRLPFVPACPGGHSTRVGNLAELAMGANTTLFAECVYRSDEGRSFIVLHWESFRIT